MDDSDPDHFIAAVGGVPGYLVFCYDALLTRAT